MYHIILSHFKDVDSEFQNLHLSPVTIDAIKKYKPYSYQQSLRGRLLVCKLAKISKNDVEDFIISSLTSFYYDRYKIFWSISHKEERLCATISEKPIGVDVEINHRKNKTLFDIMSDEEWRVVGNKTWNNFYRSWTSKEASLKALSLPLDDIQKIIITQKKNDILFLRYSGHTTIAQTLTKENVIISVAQQSTDN